MWPFSKKKRATEPTSSFQEFMKTYVPPEPVPLQNPIEVETVCPLCASLFPPEYISADYPFCPDCSSEAIEFEVQPLQDFLAIKSLADLDDILTRWEAVEGFLPDYKKLKSERIRHLKALKLAML